MTGGGWADPENTADAPAARREAGLAQRIFLLHIWKCGGTQFCVVVDVLVPKVLENVVQHARGR